MNNLLGQFTRVHTGDRKEKRLTTFNKIDQQNFLVHIFFRLKTAGRYGSNWMVCNLLSAL